LIFQQNYVCSFLNYYFFFLNLRHDYTENDIIDAIVHRRPISIKAMYYLLEKRLKQGLHFPDVDFVFDDNEINVEILSNKNKSSNINVNHANTGLNSGLSTLTKHNSQLLPKRNNIKDNNSINRTTSQKNVDFKFIYNNMNSFMTKNNNNNNENDGSNPNTINNNAAVGRPESALSSKSPSPDFSLAINPIRTGGGTSSSTATNVGTPKNTRSNYHDIVYRKSSNLNNNNSANIQMNTNVTASTASSNSNNNNNNNNNENTKNGIIMNHNNYQNIDRGIATASSNISRNDRYFIALSMNNTLQSTTTNDDGTNKNGRSLINNNAININQTNGIRSLPGSIYRGSPERSLPRSPDYTSNYNAHGNRPTTSRAGSSKPSVVSENSNSEKYYDTHKFKPNYYMSKRSLTSCDESGFESRNRSTNILKSRQLQMGKAKIDLGTQQSKLSIHII
jgi:hypothetical protein